MEGVEMRKGGVGDCSGRKGYMLRMKGNRGEVKCEKVKWSTGERGGSG